MKKNLVCDAYRKLTEAGEIEFNAEQEHMARRYDILLNEIELYIEQYNKLQLQNCSFFSGLFKKKQTLPAPKGLYIYGLVGRGKTMMMDMFFHSISCQAKLRTHFNDFMQDVQKRINHYRAEILAKRTKEQDALTLVADELAQSSKILCFDEFCVNDIADAMILARLFTKLFERGVVLVATSNIAPADLYRNGLNRQLFLPFIPLLQANCEVICLDGDKDFRFTKSLADKRYWAPESEENNAQFEQAWHQIVTSHEVHSQTIECLGHNLTLERACEYEKVAYCSFAQLCGTALGVNDYIKLAEQFDIIFLRGVPCFDDETVNMAKRFILLVDILYERKKQLFILAEADIKDLYIGKADRAEKFEFTRTISRLFEMQSAEYNLQ